MSARKKRLKLALDGSRAGDGGDGHGRVEIVLRFIRGPVLGQRPDGMQVAKECSWIETDARSEYMAAPGSLQAVWCR